MYLALLLATFGDFASYWGISLPGIIGEALWGAGFAIEMLGVLALLASTLVFALLGLRIHALPRSTSLLLTLGVIGIVPTNGFLTGYWPNALVISLSVAWALVAIRTLVSDTENMTVRIAQ